jgi:predicted nucleotidyltransferase
MHIISVLEQLKPELARKFHVQAIRLFGSVVRDDFSANSDIDIIVDFSQPIGIEFVDLAHYMEEKLKHKVDLVSRKGIKDQYFRAIESEIVYV